ncbi:MAG: response regulator [Kiritimatiellae bacterium]|nr:response regulator [Kiritimatiellia bacterium]
MGLRVFVLEDDRMLQNVLRQWLENHHHDVITYSDADTFCRAVENCRCNHQQCCGDVLISDQRLPGMSGTDLIVYLRDKGCKVSHVALMSGWWNEESMAEAKTLGVEVFQKPRDMGRILEWLNKCADAHQDGHDHTEHFSERAKH